MSRLIDADALDMYECLRSYYGDAWRDAQRAIDDAPTVDAVEVVRCKDCVYSCPFDEEELKDLLRVGEWHCEFWYADMHEDDYCSCGKRRKDGKTEERDY